MASTKNKYDTVVRNGHVIPIVRSEAFEAQMPRPRPLTPQERAMIWRAIGELCKEEAS